MEVAQVLVDELKLQFEAVAKDSRAQSMAAYMKDKFVFYGIPSVPRKRMFSEWYRLYKVDILKYARQIIRYLHQSEHRELQYCAMELLGKLKKKLVADDIQLVEWMLTTKSWWDTVDYIASHFVGHLFRDLDLRDEITAKWMASGNIWLQRSCIISQLKYKEEVDVVYLFDLIDRTKGSTEFFIQKANGWALRQLSKYNSDVVRDYVMKHPNLPRVTMREAEKYL